MGFDNDDGGYSVSQRRDRRRSESSTSFSVLEKLVYCSSIFFLWLHCTVTRAVEIRNTMWMVFPDATCSSPEVGDQREHKNLR